MKYSILICTLSLLGCKKVQKKESVMQVDAEESISRDPEVDAKGRPIKVQDPKWVSLNVMTVTGEVGEVYAKKQNGLLIAQGDIVVGEVSETGGNLKLTGSVWGSLWPKGIIVWDWGNVDATVRPTITAAIQNIENATSLRFRQRTAADTNFVQFTSNNTGCHAAVGYQNNGPQNVNIMATNAQGDTCNTNGIVIHEIMHAAGVWHEHTAVERDTYVEVLFNNIHDDYKHNYQTFPTVAGDRALFGGAYDFDSIMHYPLFAGDANFCAPGVTAPCEVMRVRANSPIVPTNTANIGQRAGLSAGDISGINRLYYGAGELNKMYMNILGRPITLAELDANHPSQRKLYAILHDMSAQGIADLERLESDLAAHRQTVASSAESVNRINGRSNQIFGHTLSATQLASVISALASGQEFEAAFVSGLGAGSAFYAFLGTNLDGFMATGTWGIENGALSDSLGGNYSNNVVNELVSNNFTINRRLFQNNLSILYNISGETEANFDRVQLQISADSGGSWHTMTNLTGVIPNQFSNFNLKSTINTSTSVMFKFVLTSDSSTIRDGVQIRNLKLLAEPNNSTYNNWVLLSDEAFSEVFQRAPSNAELAIALQDFEQGGSKDSVRGRLISSYLIPITIILN